MKTEIIKSRKDLTVLFRYGRYCLSSMKPKPHILYTGAATQFHSYWELDPKLRRRKGFGIIQIAKGWLCLSRVTVVTKRLERVAR